MDYNLYRVQYTFRPSAAGNPQEKVAFVVANTDKVAVDYINALIPRVINPASKNLERGNEVMGASIQVKDVHVAGGK